MKRIKRKTGKKSNSTLVEGGSRFIYCPDETYSKSTKPLAWCLCVCEDKEWCVVLDNVSQKLKEEVMAEVTEKKLQSVAKDVNKVFNWDPPMPMDNLDKIKTELGGAMRQAQDSDVIDLSAETWNTLMNMGIVPDILIEKVKEKISKSKKIKEKTVVTKKTTKSKENKEAKKEVKKAVKKAATKKTTVKKTTVKKTTVKKTTAKKTTTPVGADFGVKIGTKNHEAVKLFKTGKHTMGQVKEKLGVTFYNLLNKLKKDYTVEVNDKKKIKLTQ